MPGIDELSEIWTVEDVVNYYEEGSDGMQWNLRNQEDSILDGLSQNLDLQIFDSSLEEHFMLSIVIISENPNS